MWLDLKREKLWLGILRLTLSGNRRMMLQTIVIQKVTCNWVVCFSGCWIVSAVAPSNVATAVSRIESSWVELSRVQVMPRFCVEVADVHSRQLAAKLLPATCQLPQATRLLAPLPPDCSSLASLIKLGRSDCHWEIALELSYSLCENSFTIFFK